MNFDVFKISESEKTGFTKNIDIGMSARAHELTYVSNNNFFSIPVEAKHWLLKSEQCFLLCYRK